MKYVGLDMPPTVRSTLIRPLSSGNRSRKNASSRPEFESTPCGDPVPARAAAPSVTARARSEAEQVLRDPSDLNLLRPFSDPIATVMPVDVLERQRPCVPHTAMNLHGAIGRLANETVRPKVANGYAITELQRVLLIHLPGHLEDEVAHQLAFGVQFGELELNGLLARETGSEYLAGLRVLT